jgi:hypothetical protein
MKEIDGRSRGLPSRRRLDKPDGSGRAIRLLGRQPSVKYLRM